MNSILRWMWHLLPASVRHAVGGDLIDKSYVSISHQFDRWMDRRYGISTTDATIVAPRSQFGDSNRNLSTDYLRLLILRRRLKLTHDDRLIDLGSGYGRVLFVFARDVGLARGVELDPGSFATFKENISHFKRSKNVVAVLADCATFQFEDENLFYLFNPFGPETMRVVFENIRASVRRNPRRIRVVCFYEAGDLIAAQTWLRLTNSMMVLRKKYLIFENDPVAQSA